MVGSQAFPRGTDELRQWPSIQHLLAVVEGSRHWQAAVIVGSVATGQADAISDVDVFILIETGTFPDAWERRHELHGDSVVACWDTGADRMAFGGHKWLTWDLTYMDCAVAEPETVDLAGPFLLAAGPQDLIDRVESHPVAQKRERTWVTGEPKPIAVAYADLKAAVRATIRSA